MLSITHRSGAHTLKAGADAWHVGETDYDSWTMHKMMLEPPGHSRDTLAVQVCFCKASHWPPLMMRSAGDQVTFAYQAPVLLSPEQARVPIAGRVI